MEPNIPEWDSVIGWVGLLRPDSIWKILQVNAAVWGVYSAEHYYSTKTKKILFPASFVVLCCLLDKTLCCSLPFSDLFSRYLFEELTMLRYYTNFVLAARVLQAGGRLPSWLNALNLKIISKLFSQTNQFSWIREKQSFGCFGWPLIWHANINISS